MGIREATDSGVSRAAPALALALALLAAPGAAQELRGDLSLLGQVRDGDQTRATESPMHLYGDLGVAHLPYASVDTYFRLGHDFGTDLTDGDFYAGSLRLPGAIPGIDATLGRQFLSEGPGDVFVADGGKVRLDPGGPLALTVYGGVPRYFEPTFGDERLSQDEGLWGATLATTQLRGGRLALGFQQHQRERGALRQLVTATGARSFAGVPGLPSVYGSVAYDADRQNLDLVTAGTQVFLSQPNLLLNLEGSYYKPQDHGRRLQLDLNRREDPIFELFSLSEMGQARGGLTYVFSGEVSAYADYSYQRYESLADEGQNGHVARTGVLWLPYGDGLERLRAEYYVIDSSGGTVNGGRVAYDSEVYERLRYRGKVEVSYYDKESNQHDTAVSSLLGLGYIVLPGLLVELNFEANHNERFDEDFRFGFLVAYSGRWRPVARDRSAAAAAPEEPS